MKTLIGNQGIPENTKNLLKISYKDYDPNSPTFKFEFHDSLHDPLGKKYWMDPTERLARKKELDIEMKDLNIKKYEEKFTRKIYKKLMKDFKDKKLSSGSNQFIETTKPKYKYYKKIFNEIADVSKLNSSEEDKA